MKEPGPASPQEAIVRVISECSLGGQFIFWPRIWRGENSNSNNQPADLVWAADDCVILMYMREPEHHEDAARNIKKAQKAIEKNLNQAKGGLRLWRLGNAITGKTGSLEFNLNAKDFRHVIVLIVLESSEAMAIVHDEVAKELDVSLCATIPQRVLLGLAAAGGGPLDLVSLLQGVKHLGSTGHAEAFSLMKEYVSQSRQMANIGDLWSTPDDNGFKTLIQPFHAIRAQNASTVGSPFFVDIALRDLYGLMAALHRTKEMIPKVPNAYVMALNEHRMGNYDAMLGAGHVFFGKDASCECMRLWQSNMASGRMRYGPCILFDTSTGAYIFAIDPPKRPSYLSEFITKMCSPS